MKEIFADKKEENKIEEISYDINEIGTVQFNNQMKLIRDNINTNASFIENIEKTSMNVNSSFNDDEYFEYLNHYITYFKEMIEKINSALAGCDTLSFDLEKSEKNTEFSIKLNKYYNGILNKINKIIHSQETRVKTLDSQLSLIAKHGKKYLNLIYQFHNRYLDSMRYILEQLEFNEDVPSLK